MEELSEKATISSIKFHVNFFSEGLNTVRIRDKMQVVYQEMEDDRAKSNVAKWNLIGVQFKHVKKIPQCSCSAMIGYVLIGLWTLFS